MKASTHVGAFLYLKSAPYSQLVHSLTYHLLTALFDTSYTTPRIASLNHL